MEQLKGKMVISDFQLELVTDSYYKGIVRLRPNISIINSLLRITAGLTILAYGTAKLTRRRCSNSVLILIIIGAMKVAEGILRFCPMTAFCKKCMIMVEKHNEEDSFEEEYIQPS